MISSKVFCFPNFLSKMECKYAIDLFNSIPRDNRDLGYFTGKAKTFSYGKKLDYKIKDEQVQFSELYFNKKLSQSNLTTLAWNEGDSFPLHSDYCEGHKFKRDYVGLIYLNDDFEGGKLNIPSLKTSIQPKTGLLVCFRGGDHLHEVTPILKGTRYVITCWMTEL